MDQALLDKIAEMEKHARAFQDEMLAFKTKHNMDDRAMLAGLVALLGAGIAGKCENDVAMQDEALMQVLIGLQICLAENGHRPWPEGFEAPDELIRRDPKETN